MSKDAVGASLGQSLPKGDVNNTPDEWQTKDHMNTLIKAHEIMANPTHMKAVHALAGRHAGAIKSIQDIKSYANSKFGPKKPGVSALKNGNDVENEEPAENESTSF